MPQDDDDNKPKKTKYRDPNAELGWLDDLDIPGSDNLPASPKANDLTGKSKGNDGDGDTTATLKGMSDQRARERLGNLSRDNIGHLRDRLRDIEADPEDEEDTRNQEYTVGEIEPELNTNLPVTVENLPAILTNDLVPAEEIWPEWLRIKQLPGMNDPRVRTLGKKTMSRFTKTNHEEIAAIAYILPPNQEFDLEDTEARPHTTQEVKKVIDYIIENGEFLGIPNVESPPLPGYKTSVRQYTLHGIRFQVVMDSLGDQVIGMYVYAWPEKDSQDTSYKDNGDDNETRTIDNQPPPRRIRENDMKKNLMKDTTMKKYNFNEYAQEAFVRRTVYEFCLSELRENRQTLSEVRGIEARLRRSEGTKGSLTKILKDTLTPKTDFFRVPMKKGGTPQEKKVGDIFIGKIHKLNKLSDSAVYQPPPARSNGKDIAWMQFKGDPDNFLIVVGSKGMAAIRPTKKEGKKDIKYQIILANKDGLVGEREMRDLQAQAGEEEESDPTMFKARGGLPSRVDSRNLNNLFDLCSEKIGKIKQEDIFFTQKAIEYIAQNQGTVLSPRETGTIERKKIADRETGRKVAFKKDPTDPNKVIKKDLVFNKENYNKYMETLVKKFWKKDLINKFLFGFKSDIERQIENTRDARAQVKLANAKIFIEENLIPGFRRRDIATFESLFKLALLNKFPDDDERSEFLFSLVGPFIPPPKKEFPTYKDDRGKTIKATLDRDLETGKALPVYVDKNRQPISMPSSEVGSSEYIKNLTEFYEIVKNYIINRTR
jgi:hypothetical protein